MHPKKRTEIAHLLRQYRQTIRKHAQAAAQTTGIDQDFNQRMATTYQQMLAGARDMLDCIRH